MNRLQSSWRSLSPAVRLAAAYVAIVMVLCLVFTAALYRLSSNQLDDSLRREYLRFRPLILSPDGSSGFGAAPDLTQYQTELNEGKRHLALELTYFNVVILILAALASYSLARRTLRPIEEALEAQARFAGDASHELRTPLAAMQAEIEVALRNANLSPTQARRLLESNLEEVGKLKNLSDGLLRLARGTAELPLEPVALDEVLNQASDRLAKAAELKQIKIVRRGEGVSAMGDAPTLIELAAVLLDNAIKYSPAGTTVTLGLARQHKQAELTVEDEGPGISAEDQNHIFERFWRADSSRSKEQADGYGLGLSIAQRIVEAHHGSISCDSVVGQGAVFTVKLPQPA